MTIVCEWGKKNKFVVNPDGQVIPCCYLANLLYSKTLSGGVMDEYVQNQQQYNAFVKPIPEILTSDWFTKTLPESWKSDETAHSVCKKWCDNATNKKSRD